MPDSVAGAASAHLACALHAAGGSTLQERLTVRHREAIEAFRTSARSFNDKVDAAQQERIALLHTSVAESHAATRSMIAQEQRRLSEQQAEAEAHNETLRGSDPDAVLSVCTSMYHCSAADEQGRERAMALMKHDRLRLLQHLVEMRTHYCSRMAAIDACFADIANAEEARRKHIQAAVHELMASLTRIAVKSTTESQVLAQRILHHTNGQLGENYLAMQTMATQLRQRELYRHEDYQRTLVAVYRDTQVCMAQQHVTWCITALRSALFRRPEGRLQSAQAAGQLIEEIRSEAEGLARGLTEVVDSLDVAQPPAVTAELQVCGGSDANGWLRCFEPKVHRPVFVDEDPRAVLEEWQMHVSILLRHCGARCNDLVARVGAEEAARASMAAALAARTLADVEAIAHPLSEEPALLQRASLAYSDTDKKTEDVPSRETAGLIDEVLLSLTHAHPGVLAMVQSVAQSDAWMPCVPTIEREGNWFVNLVSRGLRRGYAQFCADAATSAGSMLVSLEGATDVLLATARGLLGVMRGIYAQWHEKEMDYRDEVARLELQLCTLEEELRQQETPAGAEERYTAGLMLLQSIADTHTRYYDAVRSRVKTATADVLQAGQTCVGELSWQAGLSWARLSSSDEVAALETPPPPLPLQQQQRKHSGGALHASFHSVGNTDDAFASSLDEAVEAMDPATAAPRWFTSQGGEEFTISSVAFRFVCVTRLSGGGSGSSDATAKADASLHAFDDDKPASAGASPGAACQQLYLELLPELNPVRQDVGLFLSQSRISKWKARLRRALMEWGLRLQRHAWENWRLYTAAFQADVQHRVTEVLRYHRRRPATLQANVYEARVRELMETKNKGDKMLARIAERVSRLQAFQHTFLTQTPHSESDELLIRERATLMAKVRDTMSMTTVKVLVGRYDALCDQYRTALADRCAEATRDLEQAQAAIEDDCAQLLRDQAAERCGGGATATLPADDPLQLRVDCLRAEVLETFTELRKVVGDQQQARDEEVESWKATWARTVEHSSAELSLFQSVQEGLARLKAQVQALLTTAATEEAELSAAVARVVRVVDEASAVPVVDLGAAMHALFKKGPLATSPEGDGVGETPLTTEDVQRMMEHNLMLTKASQRNRVQASPACNMLASLDELRELLYTRGCRLGLLAHTVEMWRVPPMHYVLPVALVEEDSEGMRNRSGSRSATLKAGRRARDVQGATTAAAAAAAAAGHAIMPLSTPASYAEQVAQLSMQVQRGAEAAAQPHVRAFSGDMWRRLPGMTGGTAEHFNAAVAALCLEQEERVKSYTIKAGQPFRQRVQEVWNALQRTPSLLVSTLRAEATTSILDRVEAVLRPWLLFQAQSSEQWRAHKSAVKLSFAQQLNSTALTSLTNAEAARSASAESALQQVWAWCLREVEDEAGLHVARCWTALQSYAHLLKGVVTPQHLVPTVEVVQGGHHRGLRHLLQLRAQHERAAAELEGMPGVRKDLRLQETMPLHRADTSGASSSSASKRHTGAAAAAGASAMESAALVQLSQWSDIELPGLPLNTCAPLSQYNAHHPQTVIAPPLTAAVYVPAAARLPNDGKAPQGPGNRRISAVTSSTSGSSSGRKGHPSMATEAKAAVAVAEVSVPLLMPRAPLVLECVQLLRAAVQSVGAQGNDAAGVLSDAFDFYQRQEAQWQQTWALTLKDLTAM
ncbi:hypothetical protein LSCM1_06482 [Leishmania martiniquensis]|uniref:DUF4456 domain-containing protein n=1 Tax=Leishmania martiniquensis TaxID=1580590 RepID=A0A836HNY2_9TRYP|nr:hypothetical protein LSCM1_06482 [Leishmania martiniquensis]